MNHRIEFQPVKMEAPNLDNDELKLMMIEENRKLSLIVIAGEGYHWALSATDTSLVAAATFGEDQNMMIGSISPQG